MTTMKQRAAARRNIKKAQAANRRHGGRKSHRSGRSSAGASHTIGIGSAYTTAKTTTQVLAPGVDLVTHLKGQTASGAVADLRYHAVSQEYAFGLGSAIVQTWADKKIGQAAALSRGSITAWAAEAIPIIDVVNTARSSRDPRVLFSRYNLTANGYSPVDQSFHAPLVYGGVKYSLGVARKLVSKTRILNPVKKGLNMVGLTV